MPNTRLELLFNRFISRESTEAEKAELMQLLADEANEEQAGELFGKAWHSFTPLSPTPNGPFTPDQSQAIWHRIFSTIQSTGVGTSLLKRIGWRRAAATAAILVFLIAGTWLFFNNQAKTGDHVTFRHDIAPGSDKAILTLDDGRQILLDSSRSGVITAQGGVTIDRSSAGQLVYSAEKAAAAGVRYNKVETPRGGQYRIVLPDGTKVWLNAASSIKYPVAFTGIDRSVELAGEAYFEASKNKDRPFRVLSGGQAVEVLGTHFNIKAYGDEPATVTTLLEGSVRVTAQKNGSALLKPGQQSIDPWQGSPLQVRDADTEAAVAWKNGLFMFDHEELGSIMRKIARWYNVEVVYRNSDVSREIFGGSVTRFGNVSDVLTMLQVTGNVRFSIDGNKIIVDRK